jgi:hypothetical protein
MLEHHGLNRLLRAAKRLLDAYRWAKIGAGLKREAEDCVCFDGNDLRFAG